MPLESRAREPAPLAKLDLLSLGWRPLPDVDLRIVDVERGCAS